MEALKVLLIVPCYNETLRLDPKKWLSPPGVDLHFCFCDDGSTDGTFEFLKSSFAAAANVSLVQCPKNLGKAMAIREGILKRGSNNLESFAWIGYWDADLATPLAELPRMLKLHAMDGSNASAIIGSRVALAGSNIKRKMLRHYLGRIFVTLADSLLHVKVYDSQCGAKLFRPAIVDRAFKDAFLSKWIFDLEIILRIGAREVYEAPLKNWEDVPGSKMKIMRESWRILADLIKLRLHYGPGSRTSGTPRQ